MTVNMTTRPSVGCSRMLWRVPALCRAVSAKDARASRSPEVMEARNGMGRIFAGADG